jgi:hypothetical protein
MVEPPKLLERVRMAVRTRHYSIRTEETYVNWAKRYILFHGKKHPSAMGAEEINAFLTRDSLSIPESLERRGRVDWGYCQSEQTAEASVGPHARGGHGHPGTNVRRRAFGR